jgi:hypothetical protein
MEQKKYKLWYETITPAMADLLREIQREPKMEDFLAGDGTGLSLQMGHRKSDEIELFTGGDFNHFTILGFLSRNFDEQHQLVYSGEGVLQTVIQGIRVSFFGTREELAGEPITADSIRLLHKKDIAAMKLLEICRRKEARDYIDIRYLLNEYSLEDLFALFFKKYRRDGAEEIKKALGESEKVDPYSWEKIKILKKDFFVSDIPRDLAEFINNYDKKKDGAGKKWFLFGRNKPA